MLRRLFYALQYLVGRAPFAFFFQIMGLLVYDGNSTSPPLPPLSYRLLVLQWSSAPTLSAGLSLVTRGRESKEQNHLFATWEPPYVSSSPSLIIR